MYVGKAYPIRAKALLLTKLARPFVTSYRLLIVNPEIFAYA